MALLNISPCFVRSAKLGYQTFTFQRSRSLHCLLTPAPRQDRSERSSETHRINLIQSGSRPCHPSAITAAYLSRVHVGPQAHAMLPRTSRWSPHPSSRSVSGQPGDSASQAMALRRPLSLSPVPAQRARGSISPSPQPVAAHGGGDAPPLCATTTASRPFGADVTNAHARPRTPPCKVARVEPGTALPMDPHQAEVVATSSSPSVYREPYLCRVAYHEVVPSRGGSADSLERVSPITALQEEETEGCVSWYTPFGQRDRPEVPGGAEPSWDWPRLSLADDMPEVVSKDTLALLELQVGDSSADDLTAMRFMPSV